MSERIKLEKASARGYKAMLSFDSYRQSTSVDLKQQELIRIRASQINGCAYCVDMHTHEARKAGESEQRIYALSAWRDTPFFTEEERAMLALTEEVTLIVGRVSDNVYSDALAQLGETKLAEVLMIIVIINAWNRIGVATSLAPALRA